MVDPVPHDEVEEVERKLETYEATEATPLTGEEEQERAAQLQNLEGEVAGSLEHARGETGDPESPVTGAPSVVPPPS